MLVFGILLIGPMAFGSVQPWAYSLGAVLVLSLAGLVLTERREQLLLPPFWFSGPWLMLVAWGAFSSIYSPYPAESIRLALLLGVGWVFMVSLMNAFSHSHEMKQIVFLMIGLAVCFSALAILRERLGILPTDRPGLAGPYINHNHFAGLLEITLPFALGIFTYSIQRERYFLRAILAGLAAMAMGFALVFSLSRGGISSMGIAILLVAGLSIYHQEKRLNLYLVASGLSVAGVGLFMFFNRSLLKGLIASSLTETFRFQIWEDTWSMIAAHPWLGHGLGSYGFVSNLYRSASIGHYLNFAHQDYLQVWAELGVPGLILFIWIAGSVPFVLLRRCHHRQRTTTLAVATGAATAWISIGLHSLLDFNTRIPANVLYLLLAAAAAFTVLHERQEVRFSQRNSRVFVPILSAGFLLLIYFVSLGAADAASYVGMMLQKRENPHASKFLAAAVRIHPWNAEYWTRLASSHWKAGDLAAARTAFEGGLSVNENLPNHHYHLALLDRISGHVEEARKHLEIAISLDPKEPRKQLEYARLLAKGGDGAAALYVCREVCIEHPSQVANCLEMLRPFGLSEEALSLIVTPVPLSLLAYGNDLVSRERWSDLDLWSRSVLHDQPPLPEYFSCLARAELAKGARSEAREFLRAGLLRFPHQPDLSLLLADMLISDGAIEEAKERARSELELEKFDVRWLQKLLGLYYQENAEGEALALLLDQRRRRPASIRVQELLAAHYERNRDWSGAIRTYKDLIAKGYQSPTYRVALARVYLKADFVQDAIHHLESVVRGRDPDVGAMYLLAESYEKVGSDARAREIYERILQGNSRDSVALERLTALQVK